MRLLHAIQCAVLAYTPALLWAANPPADSSQLLHYANKINTLAETLRTDTLLENRQAAFDSLTTHWQKALACEGSFKFDFSQYVQGISMLTPSDSTFRIYTWQLFVNDTTYQYGGIVHTAKGASFPLTDKSDEHRQPHTLRLKHTDWHGALYYRLIPFEHNKKQMYLLMGYDAFDFLVRRKVLDVLFFENNKPKFGYNVIEMKDSRNQIRTVQRFILEYSASVSVTLNYSDAEDMVLYDHLIWGKPIEGKGSANIPDGSYCGLKLEKGVWKYVDKVHKDDYDPATSWNNPTAPIPHPVFDKEEKQRDIFGRNKKRS